VKQFGKVLRIYLADKEINWFIVIKHIVGFYRSDQYIDIFCNHYEKIVSVEYKTPKEAQAACEKLTRIINGNKKTKI